MVQIEYKNGELYIKVSSPKDVIKLPQSTVSLTTEAAWVIHELCANTGLKPKQAASELILFAVGHMHIKKDWEPDEWTSKDYKHFQNTEY